MKIHIDAEVFCGEKSCGKVDSVIFEPVNYELTHFVVKEEHFPLPAVERLVEIKHVVEANEEKVVLDCSPEEFANMENFIEHEFVPSGETISGYGSEQLRMPVMTMKEVDHEKVPNDELAIHRGAKVFAKDEHIGKIDDFLIKSKDDNHITHIVLREGHLWKTKDITVPISEIEKVGDDGIHLKLGKDEVEALPSMKVHGWFK